MPPTESSAPASGDDELAAALRAVAQLRAAAESLAGGSPAGGSAGAGRTAESSDGRIVATASAARLVSVTIAAPSIGRSVEHGPFEQALLATVREALTPVASAVAVSDAEVVAAAAGIDPARAAAFAERRFTGVDDEQRVTVALDGTGQLCELAVAVAATRGAALELLGPAVVVAVARARSAWSTGRSEEFGLGGGRERMREQADALVARMDALHSEVTRINSRLDTALDEARRLGGG